MQRHRPASRFSLPASRSSTPRIEVFPSPLPLSPKPGRGVPACEVSNTPRVRFRTRCEISNPPPPRVRFRTPRREVSNTPRVRFRAGQRARRERITPRPLVGEAGARDFLVSPRQTSAFLSPPPRHPGRSAAESRDLEPESAEGRAQSAALRHVPGTLERQRKGVRGLAQGSARSALPFCLKALWSRCAAHFCAGSRTRFRCAAPFRSVRRGRTWRRCGPRSIFHPNPVIPAGAQRRAGISIRRRRNLPGMDPGSGPG